MSQPMSNQEMRELADHCAVHAMQWKEVPSVLDLSYSGTFAVHGAIFIKGIGSEIKTWNPTANKSDALEVLEKCCERNVYGVPSIMVWKSDGVFYCNVTNGGSLLAQAETLPLAICKFAKKFFSPTEKGQA